MYQAGQRDFDMSLVCVWSGPQGGRMHDTLTTEKIKNGDIVTVEVWGVDNHYKAGAQASIYVGSNPPANIVAAYDLNAKMHAAAQKAVKAGATAGDVFDGANSVYRPARGADYYWRCGGSMGLTVFTIDLVNGRKDVLKPRRRAADLYVVDDPVPLTCASTVMVTGTGCEELTSPLHATQDETWPEMTKPKFIVLTTGRHHRAPLRKRRCRGDELRSGRSWSPRSALPDFDIEFRARSGQGQHGRGAGRLDRHRQGCGRCGARRAARRRCRARHRHHALHGGGAGLHAA